MTELRSRKSPTILFEDQVLLALDKPAGLLAHGAPEVDSALAWARLREAKEGRDPDELRLVHRLDCDTTGVLLLARGVDVAARLGAAFRDRKVLKVYLALTSPVPSLRWMRVDVQVRPQRVGGGEFMAIVPDGGLAASAEIEVLARGRRFGLVRVIPEQGRKHQVRVTLAASGAPICGDFLYGGGLVARTAKRVMLHARALELAHPLTGEHLVLRAPVPADFRELIAADGGALPPDLDRRHRSEPRAGERARGAHAVATTGRDRAQAAAVRVPRGAGETHGRPRK